LFANFGALSMRNLGWRDLAPRVRKRQEAEQEAAHLCLLRNRREGRCEWRFDGNAHVLAQ
jgi:hypothetical protein